MKSEALNSEICLTMNPAADGLAPLFDGISRSRMFSLPRQNSIYSLTLDEFQNTIGDPCKSFGSMNMDEFLKNIWTVEESLAMAAAIGGNDGGLNGLTPQASLSRQASLTLPGTLSRKRVDEVWKGIQQEPSGHVTVGNRPSGPQDRQLTFGEITLEDFLVKAGVLKEEVERTSQLFGPSLHGVGQGSSPSAFTKTGGGGLDMAKANAAAIFSLSPVSALASHSALDGVPFGSSSQQSQWVNGPYQNANALSLNKQNFFQQHVDVRDYEIGEGKGNAVAVEETGMGGGLGRLGATMEGDGTGRNLGIQFGAGLGGGMTVTGFGLGAGSTASPISDGVGPGHVNDLSFSLIGNYGIDEGLRGRKRGSGGPIEKLIERRQKRMIKNRESAARSRARKQAYTVELEAEVTQLKKENMKLRRLQMLDMMAPLAQRFTSKIGILRRTWTGPW